MSWTSDTPEDAGWYWFKENDDAMREVVRFSPEGTFARAGRSGEYTKTTYPNAKWSEEQVQFVKK